MGYPDVCRSPIGFPRNGGHRPPGTGARFPTDDPLLRWTARQLAVLLAKKGKGLFLNCHTAGSPLVHNGNRRPFPKDSDVGTRRQRIRADPRSRMVGITSAAALGWYGRQHRCKERDFQRGLYHGTTVRGVGRSHPATWATGFATVGGNKKSPSGTAGPQSPLSTRRAFFEYIILKVEYDIILWACIGGLDGMT